MSAYVLSQCRCDASQNKEALPQCHYENCSHRSESAVIARPSHPPRKKALRLRNGCKSCLLFLRRRRSKRPPPTLLVKTTRHSTATVVHIGCGASKEVTWDTRHRTSERSDPRTTLASKIAATIPRSWSMKRLPSALAASAPTVWFSCASNAIRFCPSEGHHTIFNMNTSLLGGSSRTSLD